MVIGEGTVRCLEMLIAAELCIIVWAVCVCVYVCIWGFGVRELYPEALALHRFLAVAI